MLLLSLSRRESTLVRLVGVGLISWTVINSKLAPATSGRGLVVLIAFAITILAWLAWTFWSCLRDWLTPDVCVLALAGGFLAAASPNSAASAFVFVAATSIGVRVGLVGGLTVALMGGAALGVGAIIYGNGGVGVVAYTLGFSALALAGTNLRQLNLRADQAELLLAQTQRSHEEQLRSARLEESARIARDIHDLLAHSLAGLAIQLEATDALLAQGADTAAIRERVQGAYALAREGLQETRRAVGALRGDPVVPAPMAIAALVEQYEAPVDFSLTGDESRLDGQVGETVMRVVQEALTNVRKHAPGAEVVVAVAVAENGVDVTVENRALSPVVSSGLAATGGGYGLRGMRERAAQLGGTLAAGPAGDGWCVALHLPVDGPS
ncbi:MAG TPA: histidine kinase [Solirubrobacteraceae bacterium]|jgi:signal transduction histidine kinase|nr:histidine kinase [Solirubrobacteraceae bacterium]